MATGELGLSCRRDLSTKIEISFTTMTPSATSDNRSTVIVTAKKSETDDGHVHGARGLTPLQAIAHGDFTLPGTIRRP